MKSFVAGIGKPVPTWGLSQSIVSEHNLCMKHSGAVCGILGEAIFDIQFCSF